MQLSFSRIGLFLVFLFACLVVPVISFAQDVGGSIDYANTFESLAAMVATVIGLTEIFKNVTHKYTDFMAYIITLAVGIAGYTLKLGFFVFIGTWWQALLATVGVAVVVKGFVTLDWVKIFLGWIKIDPRARA